MWRDPQYIKLALCGAVTFSPPKKIAIDFKAPVSYFTPVAMRVNNLNEEIVFKRGVNGNTDPSAGTTVSSSAIHKV